MNFTEFRLKARHFFRRNRRIIFIIFLIWLCIFLVNYILKNSPEKYTPSTTYEKHTSVMDTDSSVPSNIKSGIETRIEDFVEACNDGNYQKAFDMLSDDCKEFAFGNNIETFMGHVLTKMPTPKKYAIQDYSNIKIGNKKVYIYNVKFFDDFLATGLTNQDYLYTEDKFMFYQGNDGLEMNIGDYMYHGEVKRISENEYMKLDIEERTVNYSIETYKIKLTNKSPYTIVVADGQETDEVILQLPNEYRIRSETYDIVLEPGESTELDMVFKKFVDDGDTSQAITLTSVRVMEKYSGTENIDESVIQDEINNAISKFSMSVSL